MGGTYAGDGGDGGHCEGLMIRGDVECGGVAIQQILGTAGVCGGGQLEEGRGKDGGDVMLKVEVEAFRSGRKRPL